MKHLMSGNEATARGVYEAGIKVCSAYPGTPSTEILENLPQYGKDVYCEWAPNEKVATEVAYGASVAGSRSFCTMKMVGLNVAADPLFTAGYMGVNGAYVVVTADDPSCHSSQNEQDNRHYARAAKIAMVEPSDAQECKDFVRLACEISEEFDTPVLYRTTTRVCHSKGLVEFGERVEHVAPTYARNTRKYVCAPANAYLNHPIVEERLVKLAEYGCTRALENGLNKVELGDGKVGVITASISYQYAKEVFPEGTSFLKLGLTYPLPMDLIRDFAKKVEKLYVIEELEPFMEEQIKAAGIDCVGKELTGNMYELNTELVRERVLGVKPSYQVITEVQAAKRPPALCPGCPHRGFFYTLSKNKNYVVTGDIGCYALDMVLNGMGYPKPLTVTGFLSDYFGKADDYKYKDVFGVDDFAAGFVRLEGGLTIDFKTAWAMNVDTMGDTVVLGTKAGLKIPSSGHWGSIDAPLKIYRNIGEAEVETVVPMLEEPEEGVFYWKVRKFLDAVKEGGEAPVPTSQAIYNQAILDGIYRSAQIGHEIELEIPEV